MVEVLRKVFSIFCYSLVLKPEAEQLLGAQPPDVSASEELALISPHQTNRRKAFSADGSSPVSR